LIASLSRSVAPRVLMTNTTSDLVIRNSTAFYDEFGLKPLGDNWLSFQNTAAQVADWLSIRSPAPYAVLDTDPVGRSPTDARTELAALAEYYLLADPKRTFINFFGGAAPQTSWVQHWVQAAAYNIGTPLSSWQVFASGRDPANKALLYEVYQRRYSNALVLY